MSIPGEYHSRMMRAEAKVRKLERALARYETALRRIAATVTQATGSPLDDCIAWANEALGDKA